MLTSILNVMCAMFIGTSAMNIQADTSNVYIVNGKKVANFVGKQLVGKTIYDYEILTTQQQPGGEVSVIHMIRTDVEADKAGKRVRSYSVESDTETGDEYVNVSFTGTNSQGTVYVIDGEVSTKEALKKITPEEIASIESYTAGSKGALTWTKDKGMNVIVIHKMKR